MAAGLCGLTPEGPTDESGFLRIHTGMETMKKYMVGSAAAFVGMVAMVGVAAAHGNVTPQAVDTTGLPSVGQEWLAANPFRGNPKAIEIGASAYNQNCARCHGLEAISGGIAPDLRFLPVGDDGDEWFKYRVQNGSVRDGRVYMPKMYPILSQEALWSIRSWLETMHVEQ